MKTLSKRVKEDLVSDGWTEAFRLLFGSLREKAPSKIQMAAWAAKSIFSSEMYKKGFKSYMTDTRIHVNA